MSYCRFENTVRDLRDCAENLYDDVSTTHEYKARKRLVELAHQIAEECPLDEIDNLPVDSDYLDADGKELPE